MRQLLLTAFLCCSAIVHAADAPSGSRVLDLLVADASNGQPIAGAVVQVRQAKGNESFSSAADGHGAIEVAQEADAVLNISVSQDGFVGKILLFGRNTSLPNDPIPAEYTLKLEPGKTISGRVLEDGGRPIVGAHVAIEIAGKPLANGHDALAKSPIVKLGAWGHLHSKLFLGGKPGANQPMTAVMTNSLQRRSQHKPDSFHQLTTTADADGNFAFDRVPPGPLQMGREVREQMGSMVMGTQSPQVKLEIAVGQTINLQIGGDGRLVTGKAILPPEVARRSDWNWSFCMAENDAIALAMPEAIRNGSEAEQAKWREEHIKTDAGKAFEEAQKKASATKRYYPLQMSRDGTFRVENILPGEYQFGFLACGIDPVSTPPLGGPALASGSVKFTVPSGPADQPVEIPPVQLKAAPGSTNPSP